MGVRLMLDDFGTGWSSLAYLKRFPLDGLKIDREFVDGARQRAGGHGDRRGGLSMAAALELDVIAEGVETDAAARVAARAGVRAGAGLPAGAADAGGELAALDGW